jgi:hypothetical protein
VNGRVVLNRAPRDKGRSAADTAPGGHASPGAETARPQADAPHISDHAILRFLERAYGLDVEAVRAEMMVEVKAAVDFGASVVICHGVRIVIRDGVQVVTALPKRRR